jgi:hypothetical protein
MIPPDQKTHQTVSLGKYNSSSSVICGLSSHQNRQFCLFTPSADESKPYRRIFSYKIAIVINLFQVKICKFTTFAMVTAEIVNITEFTEKKFHGIL